MPAVAKKGTAASSSPIYVYDPHLCCTSCGFNRVIAGYDNVDAVADVQLTSFGLIRSISGTTSDTDPTPDFTKSTSKAKITNVNLNDVDFESTNAALGNIGSIVGIVNSKEVEMTQNKVGETKIDVAGAGIGGLAGKILAETSVKVDNNYVTGFAAQESGYVKGGAAVGGMIGNVQSAKIDVTMNTISLAEDIEGTTQVGGAIGVANSPAGTTDYNNFLGNQVAANNIKATEGSYAGGLIGQLTAPKAIIGFKTNESKKIAAETVINVAGEISASDRFAAGLVGQNDAELIVAAAKIDAGTVRAVEGYAGGEVGQTSKNLQVGVDNVTVNRVVTSANAVTEVNIDKLSAAFAAGGIVGANDNNAEVTLLATTLRGSSTYNSAINIAVEAFECTKADVKTTYFDPQGDDSKAQMAGTMSNVIGLLDGNLKVTATKSTAAYATALGEEAPVDLLDVDDNLDGDMKLAVCYDMHPDRQGNVQFEGGTAYWGDSNGLVGWGQSGSYTINNGQATADQAILGGFNLYKTQAQYE